MTVYAIGVEGADAKDLYFVEREVSDATVKEISASAERDRFGMPGVVEAVILVSTVTALSGAVAWILKNRKKGRIRIHREETIEVDFDKSTSSADVVGKVMGAGSSLASSIKLEKPSNA